MSLPVHLWSSGDHALSALSLLIVSSMASVLFHFLIARQDVDRVIWSRPFADVVMFVLFLALAFLTLEPS